MSDNYQAVYDAVRSRFSNCDVGDAIDRAIRDMNFSFYVEIAMQRVQEAAAEYERPSAVYKPRISIDGNKWCALYGDNLQDGVAGFGDSVAAAMYDFDANWCKKLTPTAAGE